MLSSTAFGYISGDNGSGKSGYGRVLRTLCRARGRDRKLIRPNVYSEDSPTLSAKALLQIDGQDKPVSVFWEQDDESPAQMSSISIFDADSAYCYVEDKNDVAFMPFGLDLFHRLCSVCGEVELRLQAELAPLNDHPDYSELLGDHEVGQFVSVLSSTSSVEKLKQLAVFTDQDASRLNVVEAEITTLNTSDPVKQAQDLRAKLSRYQKIEATEKPLTAKKYLGSNAVNGACFAKYEVIQRPR